jgi:hypothetical protein
MNFAPLGGTPRTGVRWIRFAQQGRATPTAASSRRSVAGGLMHRLSVLLLGWAVLVAIGLVFPQSAVVIGLAAALWFVGWAISRVRRHFDAVSDHPRHAGYALGKPAGGAAACPSGDCGAGPARESEPAKR